MPSFILHLLHGQKILEKSDLKYSGEEWKKFMAGLLMPDSKKGDQKEQSHFYSSDKKNTLLIPDLQKFLMQYRNCMQNPFVMGYTAHLYLDKVFFEDYFLRYVEFRDKNDTFTLLENEIRYVFLVKSGKRIKLEELYSDEYLYSDYTKLNHSLIHRNNIQQPEYITFTSPIKGINDKDYKNILELLHKYLFERYTDDITLQIFDINDLEKAVEEYAYGFICWYENEKNNI